MSINSLLLSILKLGAENSDGIWNTYQDWKFTISMVLWCAGCWEVLAKSKLATREAQREWEAKAEEALTAIGLTIDPSQYQYISDATDGPNAWKKLQAVYEKNSRATRIMLIHQFYDTRHNPDKPICDYINPIIQVARQLKAIGIKLENKTLIDVLIMNLNEQWSNIVATLSAAIGTLNTIADITGALVNEEGRQKAITDLAGSSNHALAAHGKFLSDVTSEK